MSEQQEPYVVEGGVTAASIILRSQESYRRDARFRAIATSCVARAHGDYGPIDPEDAAQAAHEIALQATSHLLQCIYEQDAELLAMRTERDRYKALALNGLNLSNPVIAVRQNPPKSDA